MTLKKVWIAGKDGRKNPSLAVTINVTERKVYNIEQGDFIETRIIRVVKKEELQQNTNKTKEKTKPKWQTNQ